MLSDRDKLIAVRDTTDKHTQFEVLASDILSFVEQGYVDIKARGSNGVVLAAISENGRLFLDELDKQDKEHVTKGYYPVYQNGTLPKKLRSEKTVKPHYPFDFLAPGNFFFVGTINAKEEQMVRSASSTAKKSLGETPTMTYEVRKMKRYELIGDFMCPCDGVAVMCVEITE